jgi:SNF2 family DNA or RNA helicase
MPRVSLLIADDVGLGKTIEAGLILSELIIRARVRRVMILCPASLRGQWQTEMQRSFHCRSTKLIAKLPMNCANGWDSTPTLGVRSNASSLPTITFAKLMF